MKALVWLPLALCVSSCSMNVIPVHPSQIKSAQEAKAPLQRGPTAPGYFKKTWDFSEKKGFLFDPSKVEINGGFAKLLPSHEKSGPVTSVVEVSLGAPFLALEGFAETIGPQHRGSIKYQLSNNGSSWFYFNGHKWVPASKTPDQANTASQIQGPISRFHSDVGKGAVVVKAFLTSPAPGIGVELKQIQIMGIAPKLDGWD